jgi:hypothetical protein
MQLPRPLVVAACDNGSEEQITEEPISFLSLFAPLASP